MASAPRSISLTFSENVGSGFVAVTAPGGSSLTTSNVRTLDRDLTADVAASDERGRFTLAYRVVSADGHPVAGEVRFTTTAGREVKQVEAPEQESFVHRHQGHLALGLAAAVLAIGLILAPLRRGRDA